MNKLYLVIILFTSLFYTSVLGADYGQECFKPDDCMSDGFMYCSKYNSCSCIEGVDLIYDSLTKKCSLGRLANCHIQSNPGDGKEPTCISGSTCTKTEWGQDPLKGVCTCNKGYQDHPQDRKCVARIPYGDKCETSVKPGEFLHQCLEFNDCTDGKCSCGATLVYDRQTQECTIPFGAICHTTPEIGQEPLCSSNAICETQSWIPDLTKGACTCKNGFVNLPQERRCIKQNSDIGEYCELNHPVQFHSCNGFSNCHEGKCDCVKSGVDIIKDEEINKCGLATGSSCDKDNDPNNNEPTCVTNSQCITPSWSQDPNKGVCSCNTKYEIHGQTRKCVRRIDIGSQCEFKSPIEFISSCIEYAECNSLKRCSCWKNFEIRVGDLSTCNIKGTGLVDEPCFLVNSTCTSNAACQKSSDNSPEADVIGYCKCNRGFLSNSSKACDWSPKKYGDSCEVKDECDYTKSITCNTNTKECRCANVNTMVLNESGNECESLADPESYCSLPGSEIEVKCIKDAVCTQNPNNATIGYCRCLTGFDVTTNKFCTKNTLDNGTGTLGVSSFLIFGILGYFLF